MRIDKKALATCICIPLIVGAVSGFITKGGMKAFEALKKPFLSPPGWLFPIAWTILYVLMGIASYLTYNARRGVKTEESRQELESALVFYGIQLAFNFCWAIIFFNFKAYLIAFIWLVAMWILIIITMYKFIKIERRSTYLMIPYVLWVTFAGYLNLGVYLLNR